MGNREGREDKEGIENMEGRRNRKDMDKYGMKEK